MHERDREHGPGADGVAGVPGARNVRLRSGGVRVALVGAATVAVMLLAALHLHESAALVMSWSRGSLTAVQPSEGAMYWAPLDHDAWSGTRGPSGARLLEDGVPLPIANALHDDIRTLGAGRYSFWGRGVLFSTPDGTDPASNGRLYTYLGPRPVAPVARWALRVLAIALLGLAVAAGATPLPVREEVGARVDRGARPHPSRSALRRLALACTLLFLVALAIRLAGYGIIAADPVRYTEGFRVMGVPFNDARAWDTQAELLLEGRGLYPGWEGRRPLYSIFLAAVYFWTGPSSMVAIVTNLVISALAVPLAFLAGRGLAGPGAGAVVGLFGAAILAVHPTLIDAATTPASETLGITLAAASVVLAIAAASRRGMGRPLLAGVCFGLSNLARPAILLAFPAWIAAIALARGRLAPPGRRVGTGVLAAAMLVAGAAIAVGPWVVRQKMTYGIWSMSDNSAALLYAATAPEHGVWSDRVYQDAARDGIPESIPAQYRYFKERTGANLRAHGRWYVGHVARSAGRATLDLVHGVPRDAGLVALGAMLVAGLGGSGGAGRRRTLSIVAAAFVAIFAGGAFAPWPVVVGGLVAVSVVAGAIARPAVTVLLVSTLLAAPLTSGLLGGVALDRTNLLVSWITGLLFAHGAWAVAATVRRVAGRAEPPPGHEAATPVAPAATRRPFIRAALVAIGVVLLGVPWAVMLYRNYVAPRPDPPHPVLTAAERGTLAAQLAVRWPGSSAPDMDAAIVADPGALTVERGVLTRFVYRLPADAVFDHWSRHLAKRGYDRTYVQLGLARGGRKIMLPGTLPVGWIGREVVVFAVPNLDTARPVPGNRPLLEVIAIAPLRPGVDGDRDGATSDVIGAVDWPAAVFATGPAHLDIVRRHWPRRPDAAVGSGAIPGPGG